MQSGLIGALLVLGNTAVAVDLTTPEAAASGMSGVRVVVPGLVGTAPAAYPALGGRRVGSWLGQGRHLQTLALQPAWCP